MKTSVVSKCSTEVEAKGRVGEGDRLLNVLARPSPFTNFPYSPALTALVF
jgi:hypothetical protein